MLLHDSRRDARFDETAISCFSKIRIEVAGIDSRLMKPFRSSSKRFEWPRAVCRAGRDFRPSLRGRAGGRNRLAADSPALRAAGTHAALADRVAKPRGCRRDGGRARGRALAIVNALAATGELDGYHLLHAARGDMLRRLGSHALAAQSYERALALVTNDSERRFLTRRLREVQSPAQ